MANNIRFVDDLKVGAYTVSGGTGGTVIDNNFNKKLVTLSNELLIKIFKLVKKKRYAK